MSERISSSRVPEVTVRDFDSNIPMLLHGVNSVGPSRTKAVRLVSGIGEPSDVDDLEILLKSGLETVVIQTRKAQAPKVGTDPAKHGFVKTGSMNVLTIFGRKQ